MTGDAWRLIVRRFGGPEVIARERFDPGEPGPDEVLFATRAVGLNFIDIYFRKGVYKAPLPIVLGSESVGEIVAVGAGVTGFAVGDRVGTVSGAGAYATHRMAKADKLVRIPDAVPFDVAAATMLKGFTAAFLAKDIVALERGQIALVLAAAGGVGSILVPWLRDMGVRVIAHVGSPRKGTSVNAEEVLTCPFEFLGDEVKRLTAGKGADVVFDSVGADSWKASLASTRRRGMFVSYGNASGPVPPVSLLDLMAAGSIFVTRPTLADFIASADDLARMADRLFSRIERGVIVPDIGQRFTLADAADAHRALEGRKTTGSTVLLP